jgi:TonB-dependent starch-binding outer membrane protein SusC
MNVKRTVKRRCLHLCGRRMLVLLISFIFMNSLFAQEGLISGVVTDNSGEFLPGVSILIEGTTQGTTTDADGKYSIKVPHNSFLVFSMIGFLSEKVKLTNQTVVDVKLVPDIKKLDEIVVVGYGTMKRSDLTGSVGSITSETIEKSVSTTFDQALQGRVSGLQVVQNSGVPGGGTSIMIRGVNSINNTNEPIYVIDGVIISGSTGSNSTNALAGINPNDIENIEVLKDASATAIYGAQGANGVILITMKKGASVKPVINFNCYFGNQQLIKTWDLMNLREYAQHYNEAQVAYGYSSNRRSDFSNPETLGDGTDWQRAIFHDALMKSYNLSIRGSDKGLTYTISGGYFDQDGVAISSNFKRTTFRLDVDSKASSWFQTGSTLNLSYTKQSTGISSWSIIPYALYQAPYIPLHDLGGSYGGPTTNTEVAAGFGNPLAAAELTDRTNKDFKTRGNLYFGIIPSKWLNFRTEVSGEAAINNYKYFLPAYEAGAYINNTTTNEHSKRFSTNWTWRNLMNINYELSGHKINGVLGHEVNAYYSDYLYGKRLYGNSDLSGLSGGDAGYDDNSGYSSDTRFVSVFGRLFYSYKDRYQLTGTLRKDGSSHFAEGRQWGVFPSAAIAWRISEEKFFAPLKYVVNNLKFRLSYGEVGNSNVGSFAYASMLTNVESNWGTTYQTANIPNSSLTWETTRSWNFGTDLNMFTNRVELIFDIYKKKTDNLLFQTELPGYLGTDGTGSASAPWYNIGSLENKGFEFALNTVNISNKAFSWRTSLTFSVSRNKITKMNSENANIDKEYTSITGSYSDVVTRTSVGKPISQFYGYEVAGRINSAADFLQDNGNGTSTVTVATSKYTVGTVINNTDTNLPASTYIGDLIYRDKNNDGIIDVNDKTYIGNPLPKCIGGMTNSFSYKNIDLSVFIYMSYGNKVLNLLRARLDDPRNLNNLRKVAGTQYCKLGYLDGNSANTNIWNVYVLPGSDPSLVRMGAKDPNANYAVSTRYVEDGSFLRIQNISLGYTLPDKLAKKMHVIKLRVYSNIQNVFTFSKYIGYDPEVGSTQGSYSMGGQSMLMYGVDAGRIPTPRVCTVGVDLTL